MQAAKQHCPRKKACNPCSLAKVRCDHKRRYCTRCEKRGIKDQCIYETNIDHALSVSCENVADTTDNHLLEARSFPSNASNPTVPPISYSDFHSSRNIPEAQLSDQPDFTQVDLICTIDPDEIRNRWLKPYVPTADQIPKSYPANVITFIARILKAYSSSLAHNGTFPPFVHFSQHAISSTLITPLATCLSLARLCDKPVPGSQTVVLDTLKQEMNRLHSQRTIYDEITLLAAFQAYLIYAILIYFEIPQVQDADMCEVVADLQGMASETSRRGLVSLAAFDQSRPKWESWIVAEAKRRTLFTMYMFDNMLCAREGLPTLLGTELRGIPAPSAKSLWLASSRKSWSLAYNAQLYQWGTDECLRIEELWPITQDASQAEIDSRRKRVDQWALSLDEYGTMLFAVTTCTHGG